MDESPPPLLLIVDDVPRNLQVLGNILKPEGVRISAATSGVKALETLCHITPDLVLLDIMMPEMDGLETCRKMKEDKRLREIPVIFLTAKSDTDDVVEGFEAGAVDYVTKPFRAAELLARVNTHLELKRARDAERRLVEELKQAMQELEEKHELEVEAQRLKVANQLAMTIAHEFNNPLSIVKAAVDMMAMDNLSEEVKQKQLAKIGPTVERIHALVQKLLKLRELREVDYAAGTKIIDIHG